MSILFPIVLLLISQLFVGCGQSTSAANGNTVPLTKDPLAPLAFNSDVLSPAPRFASYSNQSARASIIDPDARVEVWGFQASGFEYGVPHVNFGGLSLFSDTQVYVVTPTTNKTIDVNEYGHIAVAKIGINYAFSSKAGNEMEVIRSLGNNQWQQEVFELPWVTTQDEIDLEELSSLTLISFFSEDSNTLYVFNPFDGKYLKLSASDNNMPLAVDGAYCDGNGNTSVDAIFRSIIFDEINNIFIAGDGRGILTQIQLDSGCHDYTNSITHQLTVNEPILSINSRSPTDLLITQSNNNLSFINYSISQFITNSAFNALCLLPVGSLSLNTDLSLITCLPGGLSNYDINRPYYQVFSQVVSNVVLEINVDDTFSGVGVDANNLKLYRMLDSSLGVLQTIDLLNGNIEKNTGVFLNNLLN